MFERSKSSFSLTTIKFRSMKHILFYSFFNLLLAIPCFYQMLSICKLFFLYQTSVTIETHIKDELPAVTICATHHKDINNPDFSGQSFDTYFDRFDTSKIIRDIRIFKVNYEPLNDSRVLHLKRSVTTSLNAFYFCLTVNHQPRNTTRVKLKRNEFFGIILDLSHLHNRSYLYIHNHYCTSNGWDWDTTYLSPAKEYALTFSSRSFRMLKYPFDTNCIDYSQSTEYYSQHNCLNECHLQMSLNVCGAINEETVVTRPNQSGHFARSDNDCLSTLDTEFCDRKCWRSDCYKEWFATKKLYENEARLDSIATLTHGLSTTKIGLKVPTEPQLLFRYTPKMETIEFLCYCASLVGLWFGFSFASVYYPIRSLVKWIGNKRLLN